MLNYRGQFVIHTILERGQLFINSVKSYAYVVADVMDKDNYATVLKSYVTTWSLQVAKVHMKRVSGLDHMVLTKKWSISPKKHGIHTVSNPSLSAWFKTNDHQFQYKTLLHNMYSDTLFATTLSSSCNRCTHIFATDVGWSCMFPIKQKSEAHEALSLLFQQDG